MKSTNRQFQWIPGRGISRAAVERMRGHFLKPDYLMGEGWFLGAEREMFPELKTPARFHRIKPLDLTTRVLFEIASGTKSFGHRDEWDEWFKYLLPDLILRSPEYEIGADLILQAVVTAFMNIYWDGITEEYEGFRGDVLNTLAVCLMEASLWTDLADEKNGESHPAPQFLGVFYEDEEHPRLAWNNLESNKNVSAAMFFCLEYLRPAEIVSWTASLFEISDPHWKGALAVWILGADHLLRNPPVAPSDVENSLVGLQWENSFSLGSRYGSLDAEQPPAAGFNDNRNFLPVENVKALHHELHRHLTCERLAGWAEDFTSDQYLAANTDQVIELLWKLRKS